MGLVIVMLISNTIIEIIIIKRREKYDIENGINRVSVSFMDLLMIQNDDNLHTGVKTATSAALKSSTNYLVSLFSLVFFTALSEISTAINCFTDLQSSSVTKPEPQPISRIESSVPKSTESSRRYVSSDGGYTSSYITKSTFTPFTWILLLAPGVYPLQSFLQWCLII